jgi:hypothetical protein
LAKRKEQGLPLGNPHLREVSKRGTATVTARSAAYREEVMPIIEEICAADPRHVTLQSISDKLSRRGIATPRDGAWHPATVRYLLLKAGKSLPDIRRRPADIVTPLQDRVFSHERDAVGLAPQAITDNRVLRELKEKLPELFVLKDQGWSYRKLAREFGFDRHALEREFRKQRKMWAEMSTQAKREAIIALANVGMSRQGIIEELHVSQRTLYRYLPTPGQAGLLAGWKTKPNVAGSVVPADPLNDADVYSTRTASLIATNDKPTNIRSKRRLDTGLDGTKSTGETIQLTFAFDESSGAE